MKHEDIELLPQPTDGDVSCKEINYDQCMYKVCMYLCSCYHACFVIVSLCYLITIGTRKSHAELIWLCGTLDNEQ